MKRPDSAGNKGGIAPGTEPQQRKKAPSPKPEPKPKIPVRPKHPMGPTYGERPSVWQSLADLLHDDDHR